MGRVVHFDITADDPERAARFYREAFGWQVERWNGPMEYWLIRTGEPTRMGIDGGMGRRSGPSPGVNNIIDVDSVDKAAERIKAGGGRILQSKTAVPGIGYTVTFQDTEGNTFVAMERDASAVLEREASAG